MSTDNTNAEEAFQGRVAIITGASSGIGEAIALSLGTKQALVGVHYHSGRERAMQVVRRIEAEGGRAVPLQADVSVADDVERMFDAIARAFGERLDFLVNCAGEWMDATPIVTCTDAHWDRMFAVNAKSVFLCCRCAARRMIPQRQGAIVNLGSIAGHTGGGGGTVPYAAAKSAVHTFTRGLARELAGSGIRVNAVSPGMIDTPMLAGRITTVARDKLLATTPLGRFGAPEDVVPLVLTLLSAGGNFITGQVFDVNGGLLMR